MHPFCPKTTYPFAEFTTRFAQIHPLLSEYSHFFFCTPIFAQAQPTWLKYTHEHDPRQVGLVTHWYDNSLPQPDCNENETKKSPK